MSSVLVTGEAGYLGSQLVVALLNGDRQVRATVRSPDSENVLREAVARAGVESSGLEVVFADLSTDDGWAAALDGCEELHHVASPIPATQPDDPDELIVPARDGAHYGCLPPRAPLARGGSC